MTRPQTAQTVTEFSDLMAYIDAEHVLTSEVMIFGPCQSLKRVSAFARAAFATLKLSQRIFASF